MFSLLVRICTSSESCVAFGSRYFQRSYCNTSKRSTVFALSSGYGKCGVALIRVSGPASGEALLSLIRQRELPPARFALLRKILDPSSGETLDRGLVFWFPGPHSFTGEDCCELHVHGGPAVISGVLQALVDSAVAMLQEEIEAHLHDSRRGERLRSGVHVVIAGATNAGKSSLLNNICQKPAAIVSPIAGTTRDVVETALNIGGYPVVLSDTAGLRETCDAIEQEGIKRAHERLEQADIVVVVIDVTELPLDLTNISSFLKNCLKKVVGPLADENPSGGHKPCILVLNKVDILQRGNLQEQCQDLSQNGLPQVCLLSCKTGDGLENFLHKLQKLVEKMCGNPLVGAPSLTQARHRLHLCSCAEALMQYHSYRALDLVLAAEQLRFAQRHLGKITGKISVEEILDVIFRDFCIGK
nr:PREDICTED: tRNA modification GTPase GTPBP3, mitochondrial isoform X3 [Latimeria chalumnae]|eukprot:XP_006001679.1 PREDICTED: tRNA modification GTPase GTPBP3, mitochondrial isoform X3 [Latimeria chalumnae]